MNKVLSYFGIAKRGGLLIAGTPNVCDTLRRGGRYPVFAASDISVTTEKKLSDKCAFYGAELIKLSASAEELSVSIGRSGATAAVYINDSRLSLSAKAAIDSAGADFAAPES
ncbi:MAG: hypothetical protein LUH54_00120 [Firmicutes bacterium]|nr:hypothetical protein [Bacillota bacterium]